MANINRRRTENINGNFYVDNTCIDCDTCRWMAPEVFTQAGEQSAVYHQPTNETEEMRSLAALLSCPTSSIGTVEKPQSIKQAQQLLPALVAENVYHCGYHSEKSYAAASYLIVRPEGNILVDSPRFVPPLVKNIEAMGGIRYMYLTHRDDVADHQQYRDRFGCDRILHADEINAGTRSVEGCISLLRMCQKRVKMKKLVKSSNKDEVNKMTPSDQQQLKAHLKAVAKILYRNTEPTELKTFESIEKAVRQKMLSEVGPEIGSFFFQQYQEFKQENPEK